MVILSDSIKSQSVHRPTVEFSGDNLKAKCSCGWHISGNSKDEDFDQAYYNHSIKTD